MAELPGLAKLSRFRSFQGVSPEEPLISDVDRLMAASKEKRTIPKDLFIIPTNVTGTTTATTDFVRWTDRAKRFVNRKLECGFKGLERL